MGCPRRTPSAANAHAGAVDRVNAIAAWQHAVDQVARHLAHRRAHPRPASMLDNAGRPFSQRERWRKADPEKRVRALRLAEGEHLVEGGLASLPGGVCGPAAEALGNRLEVRTDLGDPDPPRASGLRALGLRSAPADADGCRRLLPDLLGADGKSKRFMTVLRAALGACLCVLVSAIVFIGSFLAPAAASAPRPRIPTHRAGAAADQEVQAIEAMSFPSLVTSLSSGPHAGDLALRFADGSAEVIEDGRVTRTLRRSTAPVVSIKWVTGSLWVIFGRAFGGHIRYYLLAADGGKPTALPACIGGTGVDGSWGSLAWWCSDRLCVWGVGMGGPGITPHGASMLTRRFDLAPLPASGALQLNPSDGDAAVHYSAGVRVVPLAGGAFAPRGTLAASPSSLMAWSASDALAVSGLQGTDLWSDFGALRQFPTMSNAVRLAWSSDGQFLYVLRRMNPSSAIPVYELDRLGWDGSLAVLARGRLGYVLGFDEGVSLLWREEGVAATVYDPSGAAGPGPFRLEAVPLPPPPPPAERPLPALSSMRMASPTLGWGISQNQLVRTENGGRTWNDVTPPGFTVGSVSRRVNEFPGSVGVGASGTVIFVHDGPCAAVSCYVGWLYASTTGSPQSSSLWFTPDGGTTWSNLNATGVPLSTFWRHAPTLDFVNGHDGWMLTFPDLNDARAWYDQVYRTTDGGHTWTRLPNLSFGPASAQRQGTVADGIPLGIAFSSPTNGWITGASGGGGHVWLLETHDGGLAWSNMEIPLPMDLGGTGTPTLSSPPAFYGTRSGVLPVVLSEGNDPAACRRFLDCYVGVGSKAVLYRTEDGGVTWAPGSPVGVEGFFIHTSVPQLSVANAEHAWALSSTRFASTTDGGITWRTARLDLHLNALTALTFASNQLGWASTSVDMVGEPYPVAVVMHTSDGGAAWAPIPSVEVAAPPVK